MLGRIVPLQLAHVHGDEQMQLFNGAPSNLSHIAMAVLAMSLLSLVVACQGGGDPSPTPNPELTVEEILDSTREKLASISSVKFSMTDELQTGSQFFGQTLKGVEGEVSASDSMRMLVDVESPAFGFVEIEIVAVGEESYMKFSKDAPWVALPLEEVPFNFKGLGLTLSELVPLLKNPINVGQESVGGAQTVLVNGSLQSEDLSNLITSTDPGHSVMLSLWIDEVEHTLKQLRISGQVFNDDAPETMRLIIIKETDIPIDIQLPETLSQ